MKFSRSLLSGILGVIALLLIVASCAVGVAEKLSKQLTEVDITYEEVFGARR